MYATTLKPRWVPKHLRKKTNCKRKQDGDMEMESINQEVNLNSESTARAPSSWHQKSCAPRFRQENPPLPMNLYTT